MAKRRSIGLHQLREQWPKIAGPLVAACTRPFLLTTSGTLIVESVGPWMTELESRAPAILAKLPLIDDKAVEQLRFVYAPARNSYDRAATRRGAGDGRS